MALQHGQEPFAVGRIAGLDHQVEDQAAPASGQVELMAVLNLAATFDDDVGVHVPSGRRSARSADDSGGTRLATAWRLSGPTLAITASRPDRRRPGCPGRFDRTRWSWTGWYCGRTDSRRPLLRRAPMRQHGPARSRRRPAPSTTAPSRGASREDCCRSLMYEARGDRVLSRRPWFSTFACRALASGMRLIAPRLGRMALIVLCSTAFFGVHDSGRRPARRRETGRVFQMKRELLISSADENAVGSAQRKTELGRLAPCRRFFHAVSAQILGPSPISWRC